MPTASEDYQPVKSAGRTLDLLELLADQPRPWTLVDLTRELDIPKSSLHGLLRTLTARGWVRTDDGTHFRLGLRALRVGAAYLDGDGTVGLLGGILDDLSRRFGETVHLGRLDGAEVVYVAKRESVHHLRLYSAIGRRLPAHATALGKALLAEHTDQEAGGMLQWPLAGLTANTITDRDAFHAALAEVRAAGYAVDREENAEGINCIAMAVPLTAPAVDAVSISVPVSRLRPELEASIVAALRETVGALGRAGSMLTT
ncbi:IclR family transcriptional regulator [Paractinoplanes rishiriensis]|uniref:Glycerol operon regulatory protein n=1 Tax=Paractinoplanes rishiriensis TaxID=1050105 RepID=A0A919MVR3_9ACTN|nr:IclR family transcriptional regulator [Actinoplanes rishiriensis]GIF01692.1 IclR family transcriptional regulator [Actinoplanes rishiriensis]